MQKLSFLLSLMCLALFSFAGCGETSMVSKRTAETETLLQNLPLLASKGFMFGHQDDTMYGIGWDGEEGRSDVYEVVGDYPAVLGVDLGRIELKGDLNIDKVPFDRMRNEMIRQYERGGVITVSWHANNPLTGGDAWDVDSGNAVSSILPGGERHDLFMDWLGSAARFFQSLKTAEGVPVPVLFRPWHEHTGSWFWWGKDHCAVDEYKQLWRMTRDFFERQEIRNLIYVYSPDAQGPGDAYMERYPGDDYVDMLGLDCYHRDNEKGTAEYQQTLHTILSFMKEEGARRDKPIALTETGLETIPIPDWWTRVLLPVLKKYPVSYVLMWRNARERPNHFYAPYPGQPSAQDFTDFYHLPETFFCKDIQPLNIYDYLIE